MENEPKSKLAGIDRKLEILNGISGWVQGMEEGRRKDYHMGGVAIPQNLLDEDMIKDLLEIGTSQFEFDAACSGITVGDPRNKDLEFDTIS